MTGPAGVIAVPTRRRFLRSSLALAPFALLAGRAVAEDAGLFPFKDDQNRPVFNYRLPSEFTPDSVPGVIWSGSTAPTAVLVEFFDYNCPYCRRAADDLAALLHSDGALRLGLVNNAMLGVGSVQAAKVQQAVLRSHGPGKAFAFHQRMLTDHRPADGPSALQVVADMGLDAKAIEHAADLPQVGDVLKRQAHLADALGFDATPSFMIDGIGIPGYPNPKSLAAAIAATRTCDKLVCSG